MSAAVNTERLLLAGCAWDVLVEALGEDGVRCGECDADFARLDPTAFDRAVGFAAHGMVNEACDHWPRCDEKGHVRDTARLRLRCPDCDTETQFETD